MKTNKPMIAIVGLGMIGASIGLALKKAGGNFEIVGHDREPSASGKAKKLNAVDRTSWNLINATEEADLIVLALPVSAMETTLKAMAPYLKPGCLVMDTCAVKRPVLKWAEEILPDTVSFVGGDPIVQLVPSTPGQSGSDLASAELLQNAIFCLCPLARTKPEAVQLAAELVSALGAHPYFLDAAEHDGLVAGVEHLPVVLSAVLMGMVSHSPAWREMRKVAGDAFLRATELPAGGAATLRSTSLSNADNLVRWIDEFVQRLLDFRTGVLAGNEEELEALFGDAIENRDQWMRDKARGFAGEDLPPPTEVPSYWRTMFGFGGGLWRRQEEGKNTERDKKKRR